MVKMKGTGWVGLLGQRLHMISMLQIVESSQVDLNNENKQYYFSQLNPF
jgi:hypothetical protein